MERLIIKNFGPIKDVDLTFKQFNVLIGEQATGKSTVAKLLCMCRYFSYIVNFDYWEKSGTSFSYGMVEWGLEDYVTPQTVIQYACEDYEFTGEAQKTAYDQWVDAEINETTYEIVIKLTAKSVRFKNLISDLEALNLRLPDGRYSIAQTPPTFFKNNVAGVMDNPFYLRTERGLQSLFSLGRNSVQHLDNALFNFFADLEKISRSFRNERDIKPLKISYKSDHGLSLIKKRSEQDYYKLSNAASGYQSAIPIVLTVDYYTEVRKRKKTIIIEEPELNLFPAAQYETMKFLVERTVHFEHTVLIATHSPYILASLNNLMSFYVSGLKDKASAQEIIPEHYWINHEECTAYRLLSDGTCRDIFDRSEGLIRSEEIDEVSNVLNEEFDESLHIQFWKK